MIIRKLKLKLNKSQEQTLETWLWNLTGVYNWSIRKIELDAQNKIYYSKNKFQNLLSNHSDKLEIPSHVLQGVLVQAHNSWSRCFKKVSKQPRLKSIRNRLNSIPFPDPIRSPKGNRINILGLKGLKFHKQELPEGKIKLGRIIKRPSGWYLCLWIDTIHTFPVKETEKMVGIDPGFHTLLTLSDGTKIENPRELRKGSERLAQVQRGGRKKLASRLQERQANRRNDRNHKISRNLVENYKTIYYSDDNFSNMTKLFGKSVAEAALSNLIGMLNYKGRLGGRDVIPVNSKHTTMTCLTCWSLTGPTGLNGLAVRHWQCSDCGSVHDRDINSARVIANVGSGFDLGVLESPCRG
jgi:IS605 OrfB family transposase